VWFRRPPPSPPARADRWRAFAATLEAQPAEGAAERLRSFLDLGDAEVRHAHVLRRSGQPSLYVFDVVRRRAGPAGEVVRWSSWVLVRSERPISPVSFRVAPRRDAILESLEASRIGASRVDLASRPELDAVLAVLARDPAAVRALLTPSVTEVLQRMVAAGPGASVVAGERHVLAHVDVLEDDDPASLLALVSDLLFLCTLLPIASPATVDPGDFLDLG
jgi:hypothetical protein